MLTDSTVKVLHAGMVLEMFPKAQIIHYIVMCLQVNTLFLGQLTVFDNFCTLYFPLMLPVNEINKLTK